MLAATICGVCLEAEAGHADPESEDTRGLAMPVAAKCCDTLLWQGEESMGGALSGRWRKCDMHNNAAACVFQPQCAALVRLDR